MTWLILSASPIFFVGIAEDLGYPMQPKRRLVASAISSLIVICILQVWISKLGIPFFDSLLKFAPFGIIFSIFATVGVVNAFNLIDGLNGLSSYVSISTAISPVLHLIRSFEYSNNNFIGFVFCYCFGFYDLKFSLWENFYGRWRCLCFGSFAGLVCNFTN